MREGWRVAEFVFEEGMAFHEFGEGEGFLEPPTGVAVEDIDADVATQLRLLLQAVAARGRE